MVGGPRTESIQNNVTFQVPPLCTKRANEQAQCAAMMETYVILRDKMPLILKKRSEITSLVSAITHRSCLTREMIHRVFDNSKKKGRHEHAQMDSDNMLHEP